MSLGLKRFLALVLVTTAASLATVVSADFRSDYAAEAGKEAVKRAELAKKEADALYKKWQEEVAAYEKAQTDYQKKWDEAQSAIRKAEAERDKVKTAAAAQQKVMAEADSKLAKQRQIVGALLPTLDENDSATKTALQVTIDRATESAKKAREAHAAAAKAAAEAEGKVKTASDAAKTVGDTFTANSKKLEKYFNDTSQDRGEALQATRAAAKVLAEANTKGQEAGKAELKALEQKIQMLDLKADLASIESSIKDGEVRNALNEETLKNSRLSAFVQAKMEGMMLQDGFCTGVKNCTQGKAERISYDALFKSNAMDRNKAIKQGTHDRSGGGEEKK